MFLTVHATTAVIIAQKISNPVAAFFLGIVSHFLIDAIPHGDDTIFLHLPQRKKIKIFTLLALIDSMVVFGWVSLLFSLGEINFPETTLWAIFGSILPDILNGIYLAKEPKAFKFAARLNDWMHYMFFKKPVAAVRGFIIQGLFFLSLIVYLFLT